MKPAGVQRPLWTPRPGLSQPHPPLPFQIHAVCCWGCTNSPWSQWHPSPSKHKGSIYQYVLVTFRGQCCCSWTLPAGSQTYSSVSAGHYVCLLWGGGVSEECQVLGQMCLRCWWLGEVCRHFLRFSPKNHKVKQTPVNFWRWWTSCRLFTFALFPHSDTVTFPYMMPHTVFTGFTRTPCPIVNLESRSHSIVIEVVYSIDSVPLCCIICCSIHAVTCCLWMETVLYLTAQYQNVS